MNAIGPQVNSFLGRINRGLADAVSVYATNAAKSSGLKPGPQDTSGSDSFHAASIGGVLAAIKPPQSLSQASTLITMSDHFTAAADPKRTLAA